MGSGLLIYDTVLFSPVTLEFVTGVIVVFPRDVLTATVVPFEGATCREEEPITNKKQSNSVGWPLKKIKTRVLDLNQKHHTKCCA